MTYSKEYYKKNKEKSNATSRKWYKDNREKAIKIRKENYDKYGQYEREYKDTECKELFF